MSLLELFCDYNKYYHIQASFPETLLIRLLMATISMSPTVPHNNLSEIEKKKKPIRYSYSILLVTLLKKKNLLANQSWWYYLKPFALLDCNCSFKSRVTKDLLPQRYNCN